MALSIAFRCEYLVRANKLSVSHAWKAYNLTNKCSMCKCIGHNKTNHTGDVDKFLAANNIYQFVDDATGLVEAGEEDGWFDWD
jgi:hypothetical protein